MIYCLDNVSMISTQYNNVSEYADFVDMSVGHVYGLDTKLPMEMATVANWSIQANLEDIGYGG